MRSLLAQLYAPNNGVGHRQQARRLLNILVDTSTVGVVTTGVRPSNAILPIGWRVWSPRKMRTSWGWICSIKGVRRNRLRTHCAAGSGNGYMRNTVLVDTSFLVALFDGTDPLHESAK